MTQSQLLNRVGVALYGHEWRTALADDLQISERSMRRLAAGKLVLSPGLRTELRLLCAKQIDELTDLLPLLSL